MKRIFALLFLSTIALAAYSCKSDDIDNTVTPPTTGAGYANEQQVLDAVESLYRTGAPTFYGDNTAAYGPIAGVGGYMTGFFDADGGSQTDLFDHCSSLTFDAYNISGYLNTVWDGAYEAIFCANKLVGYVDSAPGLSEEQKAQYKAEARFFRAFNYFYLARAFGKAALTEDVSLVGRAEVSSLSDVYREIVADLLEAIPTLPERAADENGLRVRRTVAQTLLADVYLTMSGYPLQGEKYTQAAQTARQIIASGQHQLAGNGATSETSAYNILRTQAGSSELIYTYESRSPLATLCFPKEAAEWGVAVTSDKTYRPTRRLLSFYDPICDTRVAEGQFFHSFYKYAKGERTIIQTFSPMPYLWAKTPGNATYGNAILYRYAEVLLIAAEAIARTEGVTDEAVGYLAAVRSRACPEEDEAIAALGSLTPDEFIEEVWRERLREFPLEMKAWADVQRTRKYPVVSDGEAEVSFCDVIGAATPAGAVFDKRHLVMPIPEGKVNQ